MKTYKIEGIHCSGCKNLILMELEDAGFDKATVDDENHLLSIPDEYTNKLQEIKKLIDGAGHYTLVV